MDEVIGHVLNAAEQRDWERLRSLLHPHLHWSDASGVTVRGRTKVLSRLTRTPRLGAPRSYELRDGQVYRWEEALHDA
jgi:hypothetical protein